MAAPETKETSQAPEGIEHRAEQAEVPAHIEREGVIPTQTQFTAQVTDDSGQKLIQTPQDPAVTIRLPADQAQLEDWSHGTPDKSLTWYATFWLRLIKKALHFGWRIISRANTKL